MYSSFYTPHAGFFGAGPMEANQEMRLTIYFAINAFSPPQIFFIPQPKRPPDGWITDALMKSTIMAIFGIIILKYLCKLYAFIWLRYCRRATKRLLDKEWFKLALRLGAMATPSTFACPFKASQGMSLCYSQLVTPNNITIQDLLELLTIQDDFESEEQYHDAKNGFEYNQFFFDAMDGHTKQQLLLTNDKVSVETEQKKKNSLADEQNYKVLFDYEHKDKASSADEQKNQVSRWLSHALVTALATSDKDTGGSSSVATFDSASSFWVCDNSATGHVCNSKSMYHGPMVPSIYAISTATGCSDELLMGTVVLTLRCDEGTEHTFVLKNVVYMESSPVNILSTRRLSELFPDGSGAIDTEGTGVSSFFEQHELIWNHRKYKRTFRTASSGLPECLFNTGYSNFVAYTTSLSIHYNDTLTCTKASKPNVIEYSEGDLVDLSSDETISFLDGMKLILNDGSGSKSLVTFVGVESEDGTQRKCKVLKDDGTITLVTQECLHFPENPDIASIPQTSEDYCRDCETVSEADLKSVLQPQHLSPLQEEMMGYHIRLHHLPFPKLIELAGRGEIPKRLATLKGSTPICVACVFGTAHKKPWRTKSKKYNPIRRPEDDAPGKRISTDQLVSAQPGLIPQMSGFLTNLRIMGATVFVDHFSNHVYVYLMKDLTLAETLLAKDAYERFLNSVDVSAKAYHADNGRYADKGFADSCRGRGQRITFCGVGGHHQNGIAERYIKSLTLGGRTLLLHAKRMFPEYISTMLWPFAIKCFEDRMNNLTCNDKGRTPYQTLAGLESTSLDIKSFHTFGCPCYVLDNRLQSGLSMIPKWEPRARMGIYVGRSPAHASSVGLILNPRTGHVSP